MIKLAFIAVVLLGCISSDNPQFPETEPEIGVAEVSEVETEIEADVVETRTQDVEVEVNTQACTSNADCLGVPPQCSVWICPTGTCEVAPTSGGTCEDDDLCTGTGTCEVGQCMPGAPLTCEGATACGRPVCDPLTGCGIAPVDGGFCEASGAKWGTCDGLRMAPIDICEVSSCVDQSTPSNTPVPVSKVAGDWFVVASGTTVTGSSGFSGVATFATDGRWGGTFRTANNSFVLDDALGRRAWCMDANNGLGLELSINDFVGQVDLSGSVMTAMGRLGSELLVGMRPKGFAADVDGTYALMLVGANATKDLRVWFGTAVFEMGCLVEEAVLIEESELEPFSVQPGGCMGLPNNGLFTADFMAQSGAGTEASLTLRGAVSAGGEMLLFHRELADNRIAPGMVMMIRIDGSASPRFVGPTGWIGTFQESIPNVVTTYAGAAGGLFFNGPTLVNGALGAELVAGDRMDFDDYGRFLLSLRTSRRTVTFAGYIANSLGFGFFYQVAAPEGWVTLFDIPDTPSNPAWGVILNRP